MNHGQIRDYFLIWSDKIHYYLPHRQAVCEFYPCWTFSVSSITSTLHCDTLIAVYMLALLLRLVFIFSCTFSTKKQVFFLCAWRISYVSWVILLATPVKKCFVLYNVKKADWKLWYRMCEGREWKSYKREIQRHELMSLLLFAEEWQAWDGCILHCCTDLLMLLLWVLSSCLFLYILIHLSIWTLWQLSCCQYAWL